MRHTRQIRLPEIGEAGQARLASSEVVLGGRGLARDVERTYLRLAGATPREDAAGDGADEVDVSSLGLRHAAARDVGEGALRALAAVRRIVGIGT